MAEATLIPDTHPRRRAEGTAATLALECSHWTRHPKRFDRDFRRKRFGDEDYAMEELVAQLGAHLQGRIVRGGASRLRPEGGLPARRELEGPGTGAGEEKEIGSARPQP
jgi:hypothetical protein